MKTTPLPTINRSGRFRSRRTLGRGVRLLLAGFLLLPLAACATKGDVRSLQGEIRELAERQEALMREIQSGQEVHGDSIYALSSRFGQHQIQVNRTFRDLEDQLIRVQELAGMSQQELAALRDQMDRRPATGGFEGFSGLDDAGEAVSIYDEAMTQYRRGSTTSARLGLEEVVERFPNHELTPSARYFLADILVQDDDLDGAIDAFLEIPEYHPEADRVPYALYRVGLLYRELNEREEARNYLERVVNTWPDSDAASMARRALDEMG